MSVVVLAGAVDVSAQSGSERTAAAREAARLRVGPFYLTPSISIDNIGVDNNVFLDPDSQEPQSDFLISVTPGLRTALPLASRVLITFDLNPRGDYYRRLSAARTFASQGALSAEIFFARFDLFGSGDFRSGRGRPSYEIEKPRDYATSLATAGIRYRPRSKLMFEAAVYRGGSIFDEDDVFEGVNLDEALTGHERGFRVTASRRLTSKTSVNVAVDVSESVFEGSPEKEGRRLRIMPGLALMPNALIAGGLHVGMLRFTPDNDAVPAFTGVVAEADLSYSVREATRLTVRWRRDLQYSFEPLQPYYVLSGLGASVRQQIVGSIDGILTFDQYDSSYRNLAGVGALADRIDTTRAFSGDLGMRLNRLSRVGLRVSTTTRRSSQRTARNYRGTQIGLSYSYGK